MRPQFFLQAALVACLVGVALILADPTGLAQQGPPLGKGGGGGHTEAAVNNLSYPAVMVGAASRTDGRPVDRPGGHPWRDLLVRMRAG